MIYKKLLSIPLMFIVLITFNIVIFKDAGALSPQSVPIKSIPVPSGGVWHATIGNFLIIGALIILFIEILKGIKGNNGAFFHRFLTLSVVCILVGEFFLWPASCNSTCAILIVISLIDLAADYMIISPAAVRRNFDIGGIH